LDARAHSPGVHISKPVAISGFEFGATPRERVETLIHRIRGAVKRDQIRFGPTVLMVHLGRLDSDANDPSALLPIYFHQHDPQACASGELWHVALAQKGNAFYKIPEFTGKTNIDGEIKETGTLVEFNELVGIAFFVPGQSHASRIFALQNLVPDQSGLIESPAVAESEVTGFLLAIADAMNDSQNSFAHEHQIRG
jgi:hypothetical protein